MRGLRDGALDTYASDHCHLRLDRDKLPVAGDFTKVPTGLPGIGARLPLGFAAPVEGEAPLSPERLVDVACAHAGAHLRAVSAEGRDRRGERRRRRRLGPVAAVPAHARRASATGSTGLPTRASRCPGSIRHVLARGDHVVDDGRFTGDEHRGAYLPSGNLAAGCGASLEAGSVETPQYAIQPPSTRTFAPLMYVHSSEARKTASEATSSGRPRRGNGVRACE